MKLLILTIILASMSAQEIDETLVEKVKAVSEALLEGYAQPLVDAFGTGISTGLFHSAYSHDFLGFDFGVRVMYIHVPTSAKYFSGTALVCSLAADTIVRYEVPLDSVSTIFGPKEETFVPAPGNAVGIPPRIPAGFDLNNVPLIMPQLNIGLFAGSEIAIRYMPFPFKGSRINFLGIGIKQELTKLPGINAVPFPFAIAIGGAYQRLIIEEGKYGSIAKSRTWNLQLLFSKRIALFEPFVGFGFEETKVDFKYIFVHELPDTIYGYPTGRITVEQEIEGRLQTQGYRAILGFTLHLGLLFMHYDFNVAPYATHNGIIGISFR